ncbi:MAG: septum site-determining protein MinC [Desulfobulbus sp.]|jgi:septum site-determining protein MinC
MKPRDTPTDHSVFELKGSMLTVMVLYVRNSESALLYPMMKKKLGPARSFFNNAPVLVDVQSLDGEQQKRLDFLVLAAFVRELGLVPVGVRGLVKPLESRALAAGLGLVPVVKPDKNTLLARLEELEAVEPEPEPEPEPVAPEKAPPAAEAQPVEAAAPGRTTTVVLNQPVRSGQQIVSYDGDLVVLASVNPGAEVIAAGNIHVYGALRGRAMAGVYGDTSARIISLQCNPELVAIADQYVVNELMDTSMLGKSVLVTYRDGALHIEILGDFKPH